MNAAQDNLSVSYHVHILEAGTFVHLMSPLMLHGGGISGHSICPACTLSPSGSEVACIAVFT